MNDYKNHWTSYYPKTRERTVQEIVDNIYNQQSRLLKEAQNKLNSIKKKYGSANKLYKEQKEIVENLTNAKKSKKEIKEDVEVNWDLLGFLLKFEEDNELEKLWGEAVVDVINEIENQLDFRTNTELNEIVSKIQPVNYQWLLDEIEAILDIKFARNEPKKEYLEVAKDNVKVEHDWNKAKKEIKEIIEYNLKHRFGIDLRNNKEAIKKPVPKEERKIDKITRILKDEFGIISRKKLSEYCNKYGRNETAKSIAQKLKQETGKNYNPKSIASDLTKMQDPNSYNDFYKVLPEE